MRITFPRVVFSFAIGVSGLAVLAWLTPLTDLVANALPLAFFVILSFIVKRVGVYSAPDTLHSLVGIVDLAAVFVFGPILGAWVPALSSFLYILLTSIERGTRRPLALVESPIFNAGLKAYIGLASGGIYLYLGGTLPPSDLSVANALPAVAAMLVWYLLDNLGWALWELMRIGGRSFYRLFRQTLAASLLVELVPLPFSMVIAVVYSEFGGLTSPIFLLMAAGLVEVAFVIQRYADSQERLQRRTRELAALNDFNQELAQAGFDVERVIELLLTYAARVVRADLIRLELLTPDGAAVGVRVDARGGALDWQRSDEMVSAPLIFMRDHPASILVKDLARTKLPFEFELSLDHRRARSAVFVPLVAGDEVSGMVTAASLRPDAISAAHERSLNLLASQAGIALENARLYASERRRATQLAIVSEVSRRVAQILDIDELLQEVVNEIRDQFGYTHVHILIQNEKQELLFYASTHPLGEQWRERGERLRQHEGIIGWVAANAEPLLVTDVSKDPHYVPGPDRALINTQSELAVPLIVGQRVLGVLDVQSEKVGAFGDEDLYIMKTLAAQLAIAVEDARLYAAQREEAWYLNVLLQVAENLAATEGMDEALEAVVRITPILVGVERCSVFLYDAKSDEFYAAKAYGLAPHLQSAFEKLRFKRADSPPNIFTEMWRTQAPVVIEDVVSSELVQPNLARLFGLESVVLVPLMARGEIIGAMGVDQGGRTRRFTPHEIQVINGIANQAAIAIERARFGIEVEDKKRLDYELRLARQIQTSFLPQTLPELPGYQIAAAWHSAREVSGDFYDFIPISRERLGIVVADVSDKGLPASLFMVLTRTIIRTMAFGKPTAREALERANDLIIADAHSDMFVTAFFGILDIARHCLEYTNAGHNPALIYRARTKTVHALKGHGMALGIEVNLELPQEVASLEPGDVILFYTDGVTDAVNAAEEEFGLSRLTDLFAVEGEASAEELVAAVVRAVEEFTSSEVRYDDLTLVAVKRTV